MTKTKQVENPIFAYLNTFAMEQLGEALLAAQAAGELANTAHHADPESVDHADLCRRLFRLATKMQQAAKQAKRALNDIGRIE